MMPASLLAGLFALPAFAGTTVSGDAQALGQLAVGADVPSARLEVRLSSADAYGLVVSSASGQPQLLINARGQLGIGVSSPTAAVDVRGGADNGDIGMLARVGNSSGSASSVQFVFSPSAGLYPHSLRTRATAYGYFGNGIDFYLWRSTQTPSALGTTQALSLESVSSSMASFHVTPAGVADVELEVSRGATTGGGTMLYASAGMHSSRARKSAINYIAGDAAAYEDVRSLRHAAFRYAGAREAQRGLIYEEAPRSIAGEGETIVLDHRVLNLAMALRTAARRIERLERRLGLEPLRQGASGRQP